MPIEELIALLAQQMTSINPNLLASAMPINNVSPANIASAMSPNVLLSSGLVDPSTIKSGIAGTYQEMLADWESRYNATLPYEASDAILAPITSKYVGNDEVSSFMNEMFTAIKNGTTTAEKVKTAIAASDSVAPDAVKAAYANVSVDLDNFGKLATTQSTAKAKFDYDQAQKGVTTAPPPTLQQARQKFYKDIGAPEMALLPDAGTPYEFDPSLFADKETSDLLSSQIAKQEGFARRTKTGSDYTQKQADVYTAKGNLDQATRRGEIARQEYLAKNIPSGVDDWTVRTSSVYSRKRDAADALAKDTMQRVLTQLNKSSTPVSVETPYKQSQQNLLRLRGAQASADAYNQEVADLVAQKLAAKGRTPNQDVINQLLGYASTVNKKK